MRIDCPEVDSSTLVGLCMHVSAHLEQQHGNEDGLAPVRNELDVLYMQQ
jgi:hypothetical protein